MIFSENRSPLFVIMLLDDLGRESRRLACIEIGQRAGAVRRLDMRLQIHGEGAFLERDWRGVEQVGQGLRNARLRRPASPTSRPGVFATCQEGPFRPRVRISEWSCRKEGV